MHEDAFIATFLNPYYQANKISTIFLFSINICSQTKLMSVSIKERDEDGHFNDVNR